MSPVAALTEFLRARRLDSPHISGLVVALSAGADSYAMLCAAAQVAAVEGFRLRAVHVHHGLHAEADRWVALAQQQAATWRIPLLVVRVAVPLQASVENAARRARYDALTAVLAMDEALLLAHHQDDQAETLLLRLMRGAGVHGLAAMRAQSQWQPSESSRVMWRWRPWLGQSRENISDWLGHVSDMPVVVDPANADLRFDRSVLRHQLMPVLNQRWPQASALLARSSQQLAQQADALHELSDALLRELSTDGSTLDIDALYVLTDASRQAVIARWLQRRGAPTLPHRYWPRIGREFLQSRADAQPQLAWAGWSLRRYRQRLYLRNDAAVSALPPAVVWLNPRHSMEWAGRCWSARELCPELSDNHPLFAQPWRLAGRCGGERLRLGGQGQSVSLKHWCQAQGIPPWQRQHVVCVWAGDDVVALRLI